MTSQDREAIIAAVKWGAQYVLDHIIVDVPKNVAEAARGYADSLEAGLRSSEEGRAMAEALVISHEGHIAALERRLAEVATEVNICEVPHIALHPNQMYRCTQCGELIEHAACWWREENGVRTLYHEGAHIGQVCGPVVPDAPLPHEWSVMGRCLHCGTARTVDNQREVCKARKP